jgi:4-methyl-5(b-hydroxyethyl)-thiazole monophosphate biosynthesis
MDRQLEIKSNFLQYFAEDSMVCIFLADGFEEMEAITPIDLLRRAGIEVKTVAVGKNPQNLTVVGSHKIPITADLHETEIDNILQNLEMIVLPGGMPGTKNLEASDFVQKSIDFCVKNDIYISAICAAPSILGHLSLLDNKKATCYPGFEKELGKFIQTGDKVAVDGKIITSKGAGTAIDFSLKIIEKLRNKELSDKISKSIIY